MPLVISHAAKRVAHVDNLALLSLILGHSDFDGEDWAAGDEIAFEDGTISTIEQVPDEEFYAWSDPERVEMEAMTALIFKYLQPGPWDAVKPGDWKALFAAIRDDAKPKLDRRVTAVFFGALSVAVMYSGLVHVWTLIQTSPLSADAPATPFPALAFGVAVLGLVGLILSVLYPFIGRELSTGATASK